MLASRQKTMFLILTAGILGFAINSSSAQVRRYQPSRPTTSSYLNLTRFNPTPTPNYYSLVRPAQQQRAFNQQERALRSQQAGAILQLQNDVQRGLQAAGTTGNRSSFLRPSSRSSFGGTQNRYFQTNTIRLGRQ